MNLTPKQRKKLNDIQSDCYYYAGFGLADFVFHWWNVEELKLWRKR